MLIRKLLGLNDCAIKFASADEGVFTGYGSVFGVVDKSNDIIMPGAYADVLASGDPVDVYVNHDWLNSQLPVGRWSNLKEDGRGLIGDASLVMKMSRAADAYWAMKAGLVAGLSVAIVPDPKGIERRADGVRLIHRVKRLKEISVTNDPANVEARVTDVKFSDDLQESIAELQTVRDLESFLRDAGGLSKGAAVALVARTKDILGMSGEPNPQDAEVKALTSLAARIERLAVIS